MAGAFFTFDVDGGCSLGRRALAAARPLEDAVLIGAAASALAHACANAGLVAETRSSVDEAVQHLDAVPDEALARHLDAVNRLAWSEFLIERDEDAIRHAARGVAVARATGQDQFVPMIIGAQALSLVRRGPGRGGSAAGRGARDCRGRRERLRDVVGAHHRRPRPHGARRAR